MPKDAIDAFLDSTPKDEIDSFLDAPHEAQVPRGGIGHTMPPEEAKMIAQQRLVDRDPQRLALVNGGQENQDVAVKGQGAIPRLLAATVGGGFTSAPARVIEDALLKYGLTSPEVVDALGVKRVAQENPGSTLAGNLVGGLVPAGKVFQAATLPGRLASAATIGAGYGASEKIRDLGTEGSLEHPGEVAKAAAKTGALSTIIPGLLEAPALSQKLLAGRITPESIELAKTAENMGIPITPAQASGSKQVGLIEKALQNLPTSSGLVQGRQEAIQKALQSKAGQLLEDAGPGQTAQSFGASIQEGIKPGLESFRDRSSLLYQAFQDSAQGAKIPLANVMRVAKDFVDREGAKEGFASSKLMGQLKTFFGKETPEQKIPEKVISPDKVIEPDFVNDFGVSQKTTIPGKTIPAQTIPGKTTPPEMDVRTFQDIRSAINDEIQGLVKNEKNDAARKLQVVKSAMDQELESFANKAGGDVKKSFDVANGYYQKGAQIFYDPKIKRIIQSNPESVYGLIVKPNAVTDINTLKNALGQESFKPVQRAFMEKLLSTEGADAFSPAKFSTSANKFEPETLNAVFGAEKVKEIQDFWKVSQRIFQTERRVGNPSGTAQNLITPGFWGGLAVLATHNPGLAASAVITPPMLAKIYTSKTGMKLLTEAVQTPANSPKAAQLLNRLSGILQETPPTPEMRKTEDSLRLREVAASSR